MTLRVRGSIQPWRLGLLLALLTLFTHQADAQKDSVRKRTGVMVVKGDTLPVFTFNPSGSAAVYEADAETRNQVLAWQRYRSNVYVAYRYAMITADTLAAIEKRLANLDRKKDRKKYLKEEERKLKEVFTDQFKNLTVTQAILLHKLIARQTGHTTYEHIKKFKSGLTAFSWKQFARIYNVEIDEPYKPEDNPDLEDALHSFGIR